MFLKWAFSKNSQILQENSCVGVSFSQSCKPSGLERYISCEISEILKSTHFEENLWTTASVYWLLHHILIFTIYYTAYSFLQVTSSLLGIKTRIIGAWGGFFWRSIMNEIFIFWRAFEFPGPRPFAQPPASASSPGPQFVFTSPGP